LKTFYHLNEKDRQPYKFLFKVVFQGQTFIKLQIIQLITTQLLVFFTSTFKIIFLTHWLKADLVD